jgi:FAD/FMN-containing dehydrogenase
MLTRRHFLTATAEIGAGFTVARHARAQLAVDPARVLVNDVHSRLNPTHVREIVAPADLAELGAAVDRAVRAGQTLSIAGGRHAMGGQQFGTDTVLLDTRSLKRLLALDSERGLVEVEAGATWPELVDQLLRAQNGAERQWGIIQSKQAPTGSASAARSARTPMEGA